MNGTVLNEDLHTGAVTLVNPYLRRSEVTLVNEYLRDQAGLRPGAVLGGHYVLGEKMDVAAGEAELYLCEDENGGRCVAKIYRRDSAVKPEVLEKMRGLASPYLGVCVDAGRWNGRPFEIIPYFEQGSMSGTTCTLEELKKTIVPALNEGLKALHDAGIIHKDLKPSNIMKKPDGTVAIIDFGISSAMEEGVTMLVTKTGMTPMYAAPETFRNIYLAESDYYSLGITLYELFAGRTPYVGLSASDLERLVSIQKIPMPEDMPQSLQDLIIGLTYSDISNRHDKTNPNRRWTYEEVRRWTEGKKQPVPGKSGSILEEQPYEFGGKTYDDLGSLTDALAMAWEDGKQELFTGRLTAYFGTVSTDCMDICRRAEVKASTVSGEDDIIFWELLYRLDPSTVRLCWKGKRWENLPVLGREILKAKPGSEIYKLAGDMLIQGIPVRYIRIMQPENASRQIKLLGDIAKLYKQALAAKDEPEKYIYELGIMLSGQIVLTVGDTEFYDIPQLAQHMSALAEESFESLRKFCDKLLTKKQDIIPQFEIWLMALGKGSQVRKWRQEFGLITGVPGGKENA